MDIIEKIDKILGDQTTTSDVATNLAQGHVDVVGGGCPKGMRYSKTKKVCVPVKDEASVVGGSYLAGTTVNIIGSGQTRVVGRKEDEIVDLDRKSKKGRLRFNHIFGAYVPDQWRE